MQINLLLKDLLNDVKRNDCYYRKRRKLRRKIMLANLKFRIYLKEYKSNINKKIDIRLNEYNEIASKKFKIMTYRIVLKLFILNRQKVI